MISIAGLPAVVVRPTGAETSPPVLMLPGMGLGAWFFERAQQLLATAGVPSVAVDLPGHGADAGRQPTLDEVIDRVSEAATQLPGCAILGHSFGGYVGQVVAARVPLHALILVGALPHGGVPYWPTRTGIRVGVHLAPHVARGRAFTIAFDDYRATGLGLAPEDRQRALWERITPWPGKLVRELARRPHVVESASVGCPVLVCTGKRDAVVRWQVARRLGEWFDAITWRFDDLGHLPMLQDGGVRLERDVAQWTIAPRRRKVVEVEAFAPGEGRGAEAREKAKGEAGKARSAYGQRMGRDGDAPTARWDQNLT
jgi:pimeloyl-ACP methyl ester carboxylesterase